MSTGVIWLALAGCQQAVPVSGSASGPAAGPAVFLLSFDTCRADVFGTLDGHRPSLTPRLDEFARDAVVFENAFAQIPHTLPSHISLLTSIYPDVHRVLPGLDPLPPSIPTLPQILHEQGYRTVGLVTSEWLEPEFGFGRGFDHYRRVRHGLTYADRVNEAALKHLGSRSAGGPLFLFLHYYDLHSDFEHGRARNKLPYYSPPEYRQALGIHVDEHEFCDSEQRCSTQYLQAADREGRAIPEREVETIHNLYRAAVPALDAQMGEFFDRLEERGLYDGSLIVLTSDHGEEFREHGRFIHSQPYDETIRIPLFVKFPHGWKAGTRIPTVVETVDVLPTVLEALGFEPPADIQGESLLGLLDGRTERRKRAVLSKDSIHKARYGLRTDRAKLILNLEAPRMELYDLRTDPRERDNVFADRADLASELEALLRTKIRDSRTLSASFARETQDGDDVLSSEERKNLEALGYLN